MPGKEQEYVVRGEGFLRTTDFDKGVIRVPKHKLKGLGGRNALVKISGPGKKDKPKTIIRVAKGSAQEKPEQLKGNEVALQYDDQEIFKRTEDDEPLLVRVEPANYLLNFPRFLLSHTDPLTRTNAWFSIFLTFAGAVIGSFVGWPF